MQKKSLRIIALVLTTSCVCWMSCERNRQDIPPHGAERGCVCSYTELGRTQTRDYTAFELNEMGILNCLSLQQALRQQTGKASTCREK